MKRVLIILGIVVQMAIGQAAQAGTVTFGDGTIHWDGYASGNSIIDGMDSINWPQFTGGAADINAAGALTKISFIDNPALHNPASAPFDSNFHTGDLFIDLNADGKWDRLVNTYGQNAAGNFNLYDISALGVSTSPADAGKYLNGSVRANQPVALASLAGATLLGQVGWSGYFDSAIKSYSNFFDFGALAINLGNNDFIVGYSEFCGNDVILEKVPVPEPGTMALLGAGLLGLVVFSKRRMSRTA